MVDILPNVKSLCLAAVLIASLMLALVAQGAHAQTLDYSAWEGWWLRGTTSVIVGTDGSVGISDPHIDSPLHDNPIDAQIVALDGDVAYADQANGDAVWLVLLADGDMLVYFPTTDTGLVCSYRGAPPTP